VQPFDPFSSARQADLEQHADKPGREDVGARRDAPWDGQPLLKDAPAIRPNPSEERGVPHRLGHPVG
jgi:hypothetical protein